MISVALRAGAARRVIGRRPERVALLPAELDARDRVQLVILAYEAGLVSVSASG